MFSKDNNIEDRFTVFHLNVQRMPSIEKFMAVKEYIQSLEAVPTVIALTETWITTDTSCLYELPGYKAYFSCRYSLSAGIVVYIKSCYVNELVKSCNDCVSFVKVRIETQTNLYVTVVYMPSRRDYVTLFDRLGELTECYSSMNQIIMGDFNLNTLQEDDTIKDYLDILECKGYNLMKHTLRDPHLIA